MALTKAKDVVLDSAKVAAILATITTIQGDITELTADIVKGTAKIFNAKGYGVVGDRATDDTQAIKDMFALMSSGDIAYFERGRYRVTAQITIPKGVIVHGCGSKSAPQWVDPTGWDESSYGTVFAITWGQGGESITNAAFLMSSFSKIIGCNFWYPNQSGSTATPSPYPPTIAHVDGDVGEVNLIVVHTDVINCVFVNPWIAMNFSRKHELLNITGVMFSAWSKGIVIDGSSDVDRIVDVHSNPNVMYRGNWPGGNAYEYALANNGVGIEIGWADFINLSRVFIYGFDKGCWIHKIGTSPQPSGIYMVQCGFEGGNYCILINTSVRRINLADIQLGTVTRSTARRSLSVELDNDAFIDELILLNVASFVSAHETFYFKNVRHFKMMGCNLYGGVQFNEGFEQAALRFENCNGFIIKDTFVEISGGSNPNAVIMRMLSCNGFIIEDFFFSGQINPAQEVYVDAACTNGRINRAFKTASSGSGVVSGGGVNVTVTDSIIY